MVNQRHIQELSQQIRTFEDFVNEGLVEYLDVNEENDANIAVYENEIKKYTAKLKFRPIFVGFRRFSDEFF